MTTEPAPLSYARPDPSNCPLCRARPTSAKRIYGYPVCKKCYNGFANRRQLGYLVDGLIVTVPNLAVGAAAGFLLAQHGVTGPAFTVVVSLLGLPLMCLFILKDGFTGQSPGKRATDVIVLDEATGQPISFAKSFKRNSPLLVGSIPYVGGIAALVVVIGLAVKVGGGYRWGDRFAQTKVIWKKYAGSPVFGGAVLACESCGYNLQGNTSGACPECGTPVSEHNMSRLAPVA